MSEVTIFLCLADYRTVPKIMLEYKCRKDSVFTRQKYLTPKLTKDNMLLWIIFTVTTTKYFILLPIHYSNLQYNIKIKEY